MIFAGCAQPKGAVFEPLDQPLFWPQPPDPARIHYVGALSSDEDLKPGRNFGEQIGALLFGRRDPNHMVAPYAIATDSGDRVFVTDNNARIVHVFNLETRRYEQWRPGRDQYFAQPVGIAWRDGPGGGRLFVADSVAGVVYCFDESGNLLAELGANVLERPCGIAVDPLRDRLFVADAGTHQIAVLNMRGDLLQRIGSRGAGPGQFNFPTNIALDRAGTLYVSDSLNSRVQVFDADMNFLHQIGSRGRSPGHFSQPKGIATDSQGHAYIVDAHFEHVQIFDREGRLLLFFGGEGAGPGQFWIPAGMHIDSQDRIWIADTYNRRVQVFQYMKEVQP